MNDGKHTVVLYPRDVHAYIVSTKVANIVTVLLLSHRDDTSFTWKRFKGVI